MELMMEEPERGGAVTERKDWSYYTIRYLVSPIVFPTNLTR